MKRKDKEFARNLASYVSTTPELMGNFEALLDAPIYKNPLQRPMVRYKPTDADSIRALSDEELAKFIDSIERGTVEMWHGFCDICDAKECWKCNLDWLKQEATQ